MKNCKKKGNDLEFYDQSAACWWSPDTQVYALHSLNALRFAYFDRYIHNWQGRKAHRSIRCAYF